VPGAGISHMLNAHPEDSKTSVLHSVPAP